MTWLLKIEFENKESLDLFTEGLKPFDDLPAGVIDMEFEELEED